jgi:hypothetical protein
MVANEVRRLWKEPVMVCFKVLSQYIPGGTEENYSTRD